MKGPFLTMTLVDRMQSPFLHWRGDRANLAAFQRRFQQLQGGATQPSTAQLAEMQAFLTTLRTPPNPFRTLTNAYPTEIAVPGPRNVPYRTGNAGDGAQEFEANCRSLPSGQHEPRFPVREQPPVRHQPAAQSADLAEFLPARRSVVQ